MSDSARRYADWRVMTDEEVRAEEAAKCRARRGKRGRTTCELPKGHGDGSPLGPHHLGRSPSGRWYSWSDR